MLFNHKFSKNFYLKKECLKKYVLKNRLFQNNFLFSFLNIFLDFLVNFFIKRLLEIAIYEALNINNNIFLYCDFFWFSNAFLLQRLMINNYVCL